MGSGWDGESQADRQLSGGQQQRVAIARAMVSQPAIILADEPTANLDSKIGAELLDMMYRLNTQTGMTFIFSTHDPMVMARARRLIALKDGEIERDEVRGTMRWLVGPMIALLPHARHGSTTERFLQGFFRRF